MRDEKKWRLSVVEFEAMHTNMPLRMSERFVSDYHGVLDKMADASEEDLDSFRIPASELKPRVESVQLEVLNSPRKTNYSKDKYCDENLFRRKIDALARYLPSIEERIRQPKKSDDSMDYWSMSAPELERLAAKFGIDGYGDQHGHVDRDIIIKGLLQRDAVLQSPPLQANWSADYGTVPKTNLRQTLCRTPPNLSKEAAVDTQLPVSFEEKPDPPKVFISYSHDSETHRQRVLDLSDRLRSDGVDCHIDRYEESPPEGWPRWCDKQVRKADFVLVACTEIYLRRFLGEEETGKGLGVTWEGYIITQELYNAQGRNSKFVPIMFASEDEGFIPTPLQGASHYQISESYDDLYRRLTGQPLISKPPLGTIKPMSSLRMPALQALKPRESFFAHPAERFSHEETIRSGGEQIYNDLIASNFISHSVGASRTTRELIEELAAHSNKPIPIDSIRATFGEQRYPRGRGFFGNPGNHLEEILSAYPKVRWWISSRGLNIEEVTPNSEVSERLGEPSEHKTQEGGTDKPTAPGDLYRRVEKVASGKNEYITSSNLIFAASRVVPISEKGETWSTEMGRFERNLALTNGRLALVAAFTNEAKEGVRNRGWLVRAQLVFQDQGQEVRRIGGCWIDQPTDIVEFRVDESQELLLIALVGQRPHTIGKRRIRVDLNSDQVRSDVEPIPKLKRGTVIVRLTDADAGTFLMQREFRISMDPLSLEPV